MRPFDAAALSDARPATLEEATEEGLMLAEYASRMAVKNSIEVGALTDSAREDSAPYDARLYIGAARAAIDALAGESLRAAERLARERRMVAYLDGRPEHVHDYQAHDLDNLEHRERLSRVTAERLRERRDDDDYLIGLIGRARDDAWGEIAKAIEESLDRAYTIAEAEADADYERERDERMRRLVTEDIARLRTARAQRS